MSLNNKEISLILSELELEGYYIQKITQPTHFSLVLHLYKQKSLCLYINLLSGECRLHSIKNKMPKEEKMMRFVQLLRSRVIGARIVEAFQLDENRIVILRLSKEEEYSLVIKLWSNASNILLLNKDNTIIDVFYRREGKGEIAKSKFLPPQKRSAENNFVVREYDHNLSFNEAIEKEYSESSKQVSKVSLTQEANKFFNRKIEKVEHLIKNLEQKKESFAQADSLKHIGDLIINNIYSIHKGDSKISVFDYDINANITIKLNPLRTPQENASDYYTQYKKAISGYKKITEDIEKLKEEVELLKMELSELCKEENSIVMLRLLEKAKQRDSQEKSNKTQIGLKFIVDGWTILVGRSSKENDALLRHYARGNDIWFHTRDYPGGFVFIKTQGTKKSVPQKVLITAGNLAVFYSKARKQGEADLYKTEAKNLRRAKNAKVGTVLPYHEKNVFIKLDYKIIESLKPVD